MFHLALFGETKKGLNNCICKLGRSYTELYSNGADIETGCPILIGVGSKFKAALTLRLGPLGSSCPILILRHRAAILAYPRFF
jgi:hypothetical protein